MGYRCLRCGNDGSARVHLQKDNILITFYLCADCISVLEAEKEAPKFCPKCKSLRFPQKCIYCGDQKGGEL